MLAGLEDLAEMVREQAAAKGAFPGPLPVVRSGRIDSVRSVLVTRSAMPDFDHCKPW
jgi:hypothetical protein